MGQAKDILLSKYLTKMKRISILILIASVFIMNSCINEFHDISTSDEKGVLTLTLYNSSGTAQITKATRAIDDLLNNEKAINKIDIFFFDNSGTTCLYYPENVVITSDKATINVPESAIASLYAAGNCKMYVLANAHLDRDFLKSKTLQEIKESVMANSDDRSFNKDNSPVDFFMDSEVIDIYFDINSPKQNLGKVELKRAAAKVIIDITNAVISGYTPSKSSVTIVNYLDHSMLGKEYQYEASETDYKSAVKSLVPNNDVNNSYSMASSSSLYTYANDWQADPSKETYVIVALDWTNNTTLQTKTYYYRIPFSYIRATAGDIDANKNRIRRNYIYQFAININRLGALDPADAVDLNANFDLIDWNTKKVEISILEYHFLFVYNPTIEIHNSAVNEWEYKSSKDINVTINEVYCYEYKADGTVNRNDYTITDSHYPIIDIYKRDDRTYFKFKSTVPVNYVPLYINAMVTNLAGLSTPVSLTIYPKIYVTASYSYGGYNNVGDNGIISTGNTSAIKDGTTIWLAGSYTTPNGSEQDAGSNEPNGSLGQKNFNFFTVHVTSLDLEDEIEGVFIGDPTKGITHAGSTQGIKDFRDDFSTGYNLAAWQSFVFQKYFQTLTDDIHNKTISPQFVIATQRGITSSLKSWDIAQQRCATYRESQYAAGSWRMPTLAELKLARRMQLDPNSAIKDLFVIGENGWWSAQYGASVILSNPDDTMAIRIGRPELNNSVRCVRDLWRD